MKNKEISVSEAVINRMIREKATYGFEDLCRLAAEEIWNRDNSFV